VRALAPRRESSISRTFRPVALQSASTVSIARSNGIRRARSKAVCAGVVATIPSTTQVSSFGARRTEMPGTDRT